MTETFSDTQTAMRRAIELATQGLGYVEPNPPVGAVLVDDDLTLLGEGYHQKYGGPHAEILALQQAGPHAQKATLFVTLEPCCHEGKTGPCTKSLIDAGIRKVVIGIEDPSPHAAGKGIDELKSAGIEVEVGLLKEDVSQLTAAFVKRVTSGLPWVHAKWAMTLDGKIASKTGASQWISNEASRELVHQLRGRMDAVIIGSQTAHIDNPLLTARPPGPRKPTRIILDSNAELALDSQLVQTVDEAPVLVVASQSAPQENVKRLQEAGIEVLKLSANSSSLRPLLKNLGQREMTNVLVEGGGRLLGSFFDQNLVDEVHVFVAPKIVGGKNAVTPVAGIGLETIPELSQLHHLKFQNIEDNVYIHGYLRDFASSFVN
ncbi:MAG: bifunctional diaminohydroxyphosphoribosylaminopyrimidine deaminase/5-amino-6-(5-phosphoribosylamino)uracil reductase RibD [Planctomycetes bacterium]|nr:bifunctional diaminohydroxyphosphoribosylaminopyrimidine deaminase/5-amino-6-(5-phosphoribosylamino)uracil reductase RibD [Planctomycetota bacterium]